MVSRSLKKNAAAGLLIFFTTAASATTNDTPSTVNDNVTLKDWAQMEYREKIDFLGKSTRSYANELKQRDENLEKAICVIARTEEKQIANYKALAATLNKYASSYPDYPATGVVRKSYDKMCGPTVIALKQ